MSKYMNDTNCCSFQFSLCGLFAAGSLLGMAVEEGEEEEEDQEEVGVEGVVEEEEAVDLWKSQFQELQVLTIQFMPKYQTLDSHVTDG